MADKGTPILLVSGILALAMGSIALAQSGGGNISGSFSISGDGSTPTSTDTILPPPSPTLTGGATATTEITPATYATAMPTGMVSSTPTATSTRTPTTGATGSVLLPLAMRRHVLLPVAEQHMPLAYRRPAFFSLLTEALDSLPAASGTLPSYTRLGRLRLLAVLGLSCLAALLRYLASSRT